MIVSICFALIVKLQLGFVPIHDWLALTKMARFNPPYKAGTRRNV